MFYTGKNGGINPELSKSWTDLYSHGEKLNWLCKAALKKFKSAEEAGDDMMALAWSESFRKTTNSCIAVAMTVLAVEDIVKGKMIRN